MDGGPEIEHHHHGHTGHRWLDIVLGGSAMLVSVISLFIAIQHGKTMEKMVAANTWPYVETATSSYNDRGEKESRLIVVNSGVGPAKIENVELSYKGQPIASDADLLKACCSSALNDPKLPIYTSTLSGRMVPARETLAYLMVRPEPNAALFEAFGKAVHQVHVRICYCSVFDECWVRDSNDTRPTEVKVCPVPKTPFKD